MKTQTTILLLLLMPCLNLYGRQKLAVGSPLPDYSFRLVDGEQVKSISELQQARYLILNFWGRRCVPCVRELPRLDSLQRRYGDKLLILCISADSSARDVRGFLEGKSRLKDMGLTFVIDSSRNFFRWFNSSSKVWVDQDGIVRAKTPNDILTDSIIGEFVNDGDAPLKYNRDVIGSKEVMNGPVRFGDGPVLVRSVLAKGSLNFDRRQWMVPESNGMYKRIFVSNQTIRELYGFAVYGNRPGVDRNYELHVSDSLSFCRPSEAPLSYSRSGYRLETDWMLQHTYTYELILTDAVGEQGILSYMLADLDRYFKNMLNSDVIHLGDGRKKIRIKEIAE